MGRWRGDDGVPWCPADALHCKPDPTMPGNGSFLNDSIDLDSVVRCIRDNELGYICLCFRGAPLLFGC